MATIKVACPKCGQKVSGDETFYGTKVECPVCSSDILFPGQRREDKRALAIEPVPPETSAAGTLRQSPSPVERLSTSSLPAARLEDSTSLNPAGDKPAPLPENHSLEEGDEAPDRAPSPLYGAISIVSAVLGLVTCVGGALFAPIAIIFGHTALAKARHSPIQPAPGHTLGAIGLMIGYVSLILTILVLLALTFFGDWIMEGIKKATGQI